MKKSLILLLTFLNFAYAESELKLSNYGIVLSEGGESPTRAQFLSNNKREIKSWQVSTKIDRIPHKPEIEFGISYRVNCPFNQVKESLTMPFYFDPNTISRFRSIDCDCLLYTSPSPRDQRGSRMPSSA